MHSAFRFGYLAVALGAAAFLGSPAPAHAANTTVEVGQGGIVFGYSDGYWNRDRQWHQWRDQREAQEWRREHREHYYARRHDREHEQGWRENDRYWEHD